MTYVASDDRESQIATPNKQMVMRRCEPLAKS
jgi:hypothetical protein